MNNKVFDKFLFLTGFLVVLTSFLLEFLLGLTPCKLCNFQRYLWIFLLFVSTINLINRYSYKKYIYPIMSFCLGSILLLSFYHSGIEHGVFTNVISCNASLDTKVNTIDELDLIIRNTKNNDCAFPKFSIFNITLSNLSFIIAFLLLLLNLKTQKSYIFNHHVKKEN